jgi:hypothetical protein
MVMKIGIAAREWKTQKILCDTDTDTVTLTTCTCNRNELNVDNQTQIELLDLLGGRRLRSVSEKGKSCLSRNSMSASWHRIFSQRQGH